MASARGRGQGSSPRTRLSGVMAEVTRLGRGGKRPGAGRKPGSPNKHTGATIATDLKEALAFLHRINGRIDHLEARIDSVGGRVGVVNRAVSDGRAVISDQLDLVARRLVTSRTRRRCRHHGCHGRSIPAATTLKRLTAISTRSQLAGVPLVATRGDHDAAITTRTGPPRLSSANPREGMAVGEV
jgi:hypothetical protein